MTSSWVKIAYLTSAWGLVYKEMQLTTDEAVDIFFFGSDMRKEDLNEKDIKILRQDILENLLDRNPLAIKLIKSNIPANKCFSTLKRELEEDLFNKISKIDLQFLDDDVNLNIERKKSIYVSILYSYHYLNDADKKAFELLSLFPDGVDQENFKKISQDVKVKDKKTPLITDSVIKSLENKSMIERSQSHIKLQSIIGKFAESKLNQREVTSLFYKNALDYNIFYADRILELTSRNRKVALDTFYYQQKNFLKSIDYFDKNLVDHDEVLYYFDTLQELFISICSMKVFIRKLSEKSHIFNEKNKL